MQSAVDRQTFDEVMVPDCTPEAVIPVRGHGSWLQDQDGREYIDLSGGGGAAVLGHCHPVLVETLHDQARTLWHLNRNWTHEPALRLAQQLCAATFADRVLFCNDGADANEMAIELALRHAHRSGNGHKTRIVSFQGASHGQTLLTLSLARARSGSLTDVLAHQITQLPFNRADALATIPSPETAAIIVEPIQADGGVRPADPAFLHQLREFCDQHDALLIFDEVQSCMGRTGQLFACMHSGVVPDILTCARALGGGLPLAALLTHRALAEGVGQPLQPDNCVCGTPLACHIASRILELVSEPAVLQGVNERHQQLISGLQMINRETGLFQDIRGRGLLVGAVLGHDWQGRASELVQQAQQQGVLIQNAGPDVLRFSPSLIIDPEDLDQGMERFYHALRQRLQLTR